MNTIKWGILSTAKIGREKVIPAIKQSHNGTVEAIASRNKHKAKKVAQELGIAKAYGSYKELLADESIDVIYNPLPNHLHVPKTLDALKADKHVLCEKPIALDHQQAQKLLREVKNYPHLKVMEAFMYRFHPQWKKAKSLVQDGAIGDLKTIHAIFSYYNNDPENIRNKADMGGGGLMDIGCYCISLSRFIFDDEPKSVNGFWKIDLDFGVDYLASGILEFDAGTVTFTASTQMVPRQEVTILGTKGSITIDIPFNAPANKETKIWLKENENSEQEITLPAADQYTLQAEAFAASILNDEPVPTPLEDAIKNMKALDRFKENATKN